MSPFITRLVLGLITVYQHTLSPDHSWLRPLFPAGVCRYWPTCSTYMAQAVLIHGWPGLWYGLRRLARCHPGRSGGYDSVPNHL